MNIVGALADSKLLGASPAFADLSTWSRWLAFLRVLYGLDLGEEDLATFHKATGRTRYDPPPGGFSEAALVVGRQAGKTAIAAALTVFEAALALPCRTGELYALLLAQDRRSAVRTSFSYIRSFFDASPILAPMVVNATSDTLELSNGIRVAAYPCRPAAIRGLRARVVVLDELAFFVGSDARRVDVEALRAARPTLASTGGKLIVLSSPFGQTGALWELHRRNFGQDESTTLVWQSSAPEMNPNLPEDYLERMRQDDPEAYRSEVLGEFRAGLSTLLDPDALDACVAPGRHEQPPAHGIRYAAFVDASGGRRDAFTAAVGHRDGERAIVDAVRAWVPPFNPSNVVEECAEFLKTYRVASVVGDRYAGEWPREQFRGRGVEYRFAQLDRSRLYLELLPQANAGRVEFPDDPKLLRELRGLERQRGASGRDRVTHARGAFDDGANAAAGVCWLLRARRKRPITWGSQKQRPRVRFSAW